MFAGALGMEDVYKIGDVNLDGSVDVNDVTDVQKRISSIATLSPEGFEKADTDYNHKINIKDATHIQKILVGLYTPLTGKKGVDISKFNGDVDIKKLKKAGYDFVMIRCGFGSDYAKQDDVKFENNVKKCEEAGMPWGVYLYSYAMSFREAESEVDHVLRLLKDKKPTMPVAFDMEDADNYKSKRGMPSNADLVEICRVFLDEISNAGYYPILYANLNWLNTKLNDKTLLDSYDIWVAQWNTECNYKGKTLGLWQYGGETNYIESNTISGLNGIFDKNFCYKDYPLLIKNGHYNGW